MNTTAIKDDQERKRLKRHRNRLKEEVDDLVQLGKTLERRPKPDETEPVIATLAALLLRIRDRGGVFRPLRANQAQLEFERRRGRQNIVLKARQMGITTWIAARFFLKTITSRGVLTVLVAHTRAAAQAIFRIVQRFWECLPEELRIGPLRRSVANVGAMRFSELDSEFRVVSASDTNAGRGLTVQNLHCSELGRWPGDAAQTLAGLRAALAPGGEIVMESTPNGAYGCFYGEWGQAVESNPQESRLDLVIRHFFSWWLERAYRASAALDLTPEEAQLVSRHRLTPEQIGYRRGLERTHRGLRAQEFAEDPETCFRATGNGCFEAKAIEARLAQLGEPLEIRQRGALHIWLPYRPGMRYILGVDSAGGGQVGGNQAGSAQDGDFAAIQVIELHTGLQCAELRQRLRPDELAAAAAQLAREYGSALLAVERNNHGIGVVAYLDNTEHYPNVYRSGNVPGFITTAASKPVMVALMGALLSESPEIFFSRRLLAECRTFIAFGDGSTGAANGAHDDCFMAMAVAQTVRMEILNKGGRQSRTPVVLPDGPAARGAGTS